jgi:Domain of unknown function (DUF4388)
MDTHERDDFDLQGRIGCFSLSDLLQTLSFTQKTGTLTLIQGWNTRTICYEQGRITYIAAATRLPSAVELLLQAGRLTPEQLEQAMGPNWRKTLGADESAQIMDGPGVNGAISGNGKGHGGVRTTAGLVDTGYGFTSPNMDSLTTAAPKRTTAPRRRNCFSNTSW